MRLIGVLGLPGAIASLVIAFYFGLKAKNAISWNGSERRVSEISGLSYKEAVDMAKDIVSLVDDAKRIILSEVARNRHDMKNEIAIFGGNLQHSFEQSLEKIVARIEKVEDVVRGSAKG